MHDKAGAQLRLEPGGLGRHHLAGIGHRHQIDDRGGVEGEGHGVFSAVHQFLQFAGAPDSADKVDPLVGAGITDTEARL